ncbi:GPW/gp25 family protein [Cumulibacter manganitolerans]|uniref:GPW/gp25 family protein n=1 Tax=Cumulibacter manganitolerans TaxID=1884992 RepID=UPI0012967196|nr:GPW/gp25 family protein [Cumulibacter manganitolerans]
MPSEPASAGSFLGVGWAFPVDLTSAGGIATAAYDDDVRQAIRVVLGTSPGERLMRPTFGAGLRDLVFEPLNTTTMALVRHRVSVGLATWEPRIDVHEVNVTAGTPHGRLDVAIAYRVRATNTFYNLVYPLYLLEGGDR